MADDALTALQHSVLELFFSLPESNGFVLAGGAALVASGLSRRPTQDVDLFGSGSADRVATAAGALERACAERGWRIERIREAPTFCRMTVRGHGDQLLVDLAIDSPPLGPPTITAVGPTYPPEELAARKLLALFNRAEARDFVDIHTLSERFDLDRLLDLAAQLDSGFSTPVLVEMLATHRRFTDEALTELGVDAAALRTFVERWRAELNHRS